MADDHECNVFIERNVSCSADVMNDEIWKSDIEFCLFCFDVIVMSILALNAVGNLSPSSIFASAVTTPKAI